MDAIDLNCDMGESFGAWTMGSDAEMLKIVSSANVACGFHGGDPLVMFETVKQAKENGVGIGAHPSFFDVWGFGRRMIQGETPEDIEKIVVYQIGALQGVAQAVGHRVGHVKAHGSLANLAAVDRPTALAIGRAIAGINRELIYVVMAGTELERAARELGLRMAREIYADRAYDDTGNLVSRKLPARYCTIPRRPPSGCWRWCRRGDHQQFGQAHPGLDRHRLRPRRQPGRRGDGGARARQARTGRDLGPTDGIDRPAYRPGDPSMTETLLPTTVVGSYPQPDWLIDRES